MILLDASAVIASVMEEKGVAVLNTLLAEPCAMSVINFCEVVLKLQKKTGKSLTQIHHALYNMHLAILPFSDYEAHILFKNSVLTSAHLSLADRVCLATALAHNHTVVTADKMWKELDLPLELVLIR